MRGFALSLTSTKIESKDIVESRAEVAVTVEPGETMARISEVEVAVIAEMLATESETAET
ncbi:30354_t:CDS:1, partial [Racocetra persica]